MADFLCLSSFPRERGSWDVLDLFACTTPIWKTGITSLITAVEHANANPCPSMHQSCPDPTSYSGQDIQRCVAYLT